MKKLILLSLIFLFVGCPPTAKNSVKIYLQRQEYESAKEQVLIGLKDYPNDYELYCLLAKAEIGLANWGAASKSLQDAFKIDSMKTINWLVKDKENVSVYWQTFYNAAFAFSSERKFDEALINLKYAKKIDPNDVSQHILEGAIYGELGNIELANKAYEKALSIDPENPEAYYLIGKSLYEKRLFDSSLVYFSDAIKHFETKYVRIEKVIFQNLPEPDKELKHEINKLWIEKKNDELDQLVKVKLGFDGGLDKHRRNIENFFKTTEGLAQSYYLLGMAYYRLKEDSLAFKNLLESLDLLPEDLDALYFTGEILLIKFNKYQEALGYFDKIIQLKDDDIPAWFYLGACYLQLKNYKKAIDIYENKILVLDPKNTGAYQMLGEAYRAMGNSKKAYEYFMKAEELQKEQK